MNESNNNFTELRHILEFWRDLEIFNIPNAPKATDNKFNQTVATLRIGNALPWNDIKHQPNQDYAYIHKVYVGVADQEHITQLVLQKIVNESLSEKDRERIVGTGWLASFNVNENGFLIEGSYIPASFVIGTEVLSQGKSLNDLNARLDRAKLEFDIRCKDISQSRKCDWELLESEEKLVKLIIDPDVKEQMDWRFVVVTKKTKRKKNNENIEQDVNYLNSFYLDDLDRLSMQSKKAHAFGDALMTYLGRPLVHSDRIDLLENHQAMQVLVSAENLPKARWPNASDKPLVLAQQAVVAQIGHALSDKCGVIGVNGPPGTGKTTLLCDVIANVVTDRAKKIAELSAPHELIENPIVIAGSKYFPIRKEIVRDTSIVVSSNNNNAVKNISQELPAKSKIDEKYIDESLYFQQVIAGIFNNQNVKADDDQPIPTWGLVAAALGNSNNRNTFANAFFKESFNEEKDGRNNADPTFFSMKQILEDAIGQVGEIKKNWSKVKIEFLELLDELEQKRTILKDAEDAIGEHLECKEQLKQQTQRIFCKEKELSKLLIDFDLLKTTISEHEILLKSKQNLLMHINQNNGLNIFDTFLALFGFQTQRMRLFRDKINAETDSLQRITQQFEDNLKVKKVSELKVQKCKKELVQKNEKLEALKLQCSAIEESIRVAENLGVKHFISPAFWQLSFEEQHRASVNTSETLDDLRARIFIKAINLHELTILANAKCFLSNLRLVAKMLSGSAKGLLHEERPLVWDSLFFVVPVVSTTLASFSRLFAGLGQESIGWLLIDEAGQATPQSAAGAIWRSKRAVLIGDPLQVEPVFTLPDSIVDIIRDNNQVDKAWSPVFESVQTLADRITPYGSWISRDSSGLSKIWTGMPLRTHRRCDDPMFSVSNDIAYAGQMVQERVNELCLPKPLELPYDIGPSTWFHVDSSNYSHPVNEEELDALIHFLKNIEKQRIGAVSNLRLKIYVISPFKKVKDACNERIKREYIGGIECGTIHTFQGKEADIVFLVLGTSKERDGLGARMWASASPNLLNVAVTRAKARLYVIGNAQCWAELNYFSTLHSLLIKKDY